MLRNIVWLDACAKILLLRDIVIDLSSDWWDGWALLSLTNKTSVLLDIECCILTLAACWPEAVQSLIQGKADVQPQHQCQQA